MLKNDKQSVICEIRNFMIIDLKLNRSKLIIFAYLYKNCIDFKPFQVSINSMATILNIIPTHVIGAIETLTNDGFIHVEKTGINAPDIYSIVPKH